MLGQKRAEVQKNNYILKNRIIKNKNIGKPLSSKISKEKRNNLEKNILAKKSLSETLLIEKNKEKINLQNNLIKLKCKGKPIYVSKKEFYKMKNIDLEQLKSLKNEKKEIIKQKKIFLEKINSIYNTDVIDLISENNEKEYRKGIANIQNELRNKRLINKEEIKDFFENILNIIKNLKHHIKDEINLRIDEIDKRIDINIIQVNKLQEKELDKKLEKLNYFMIELKELIRKIENINLDYKKIKQNIDRYTRENSILKKQIKKQNIINKNLILEMKLRENAITEKENMITSYRSNPNQNENEREGKIHYKKIVYKKKNSKTDFLKKIKKLKYYNRTNSTFSQTNFTTNNVNLLSNRNKNNLSNYDSNNSYKNLISISNNNNFNYMSISSITLNNKNKEQGKRDLNNIEKNVIKHLTKNLENWKNKLNSTKKRLYEEIPKNPFYDLIQNIINKLKKEESDSVIYNIDNKLLTDNMRIFPYQSKVFRQIFMSRLFNNNNLYQMFITEDKNSDIIFNKNIFDAPKKNKK